MAVAGKRLPWFVSGGYILGLLGLFLGQRAFAHTGAAGFFTIASVVLMLGATGLRAWSYFSSEGEHKRVELMFLLCYLTGVIGLALYFLGAVWGAGKFASGDWDADKLNRFVVPITVLWAILITCAVIPISLMEVGLGFRTKSSQEASDGMADGAFVEGFRVRQLASSGLTIALAMSFLMTTCQIASERDIKKDVSYFKTSEPGSATVNIASSVSEPLDVILFYPEVNDVKEEVKAYFDQLAKKTGKINVRTYDHKVEKALAEQYKVSSDGTIVIVRKSKDSDKPEADEKDKDGKKPKKPKTSKDKFEKFTISHEMDKARGKQLRTLDQTVQKSLMKVVRAKRIAYLTTGHGELNDPGSAGKLGPARARLQATRFRQMLQLLNYQVKNLSAFDLTGGVPADATMVISLAPVRTFTQQEESSLDEYLGNGGALLLTMDPNGKAEIGDTLAGRLGVRYVNTPLADDKQFWPQRRNRSDHAFMKTNKFSSHASVTTLSRAGAQAAILLIRPGHLITEKFATGAKAKRTFVIKTMNSAFADANQNFVFDGAEEKRKQYNIAAAVEDISAAKKKDPKAPKEDAKVREGMRAMVIADAEIFTDLVLSNIPLLQNLLFDSLSWLGGEEQFQGKTKNEEDVKIEHTKSEDAVRFYLTILGVPLLILGVGFFNIRRRRRKGRA